MKEGVLDGADHEDEVLDQAMSFQQAIAPSVMPEVKTQNSGGIMDLVQDMGFQD